MSDTNIEWADKSWNPVTGCSKISEGCQHCYAETMANRLKHMIPKYEYGFDVAIHPSELEKPLSWKKSATIFVNSMSDLFHPLVPDKFILSIFDTMQRAHWHRFQILTKRAAEMDLFTDKHNIKWPSNVWMGVTVESDDHMTRIDSLRRTNAWHRFISFEPLLGDIEDLDLTGIDLVIVGGESGPRARPMNPDWPRSIRDQCIDQKVPLFFKQWGEWAPYDGKIIRLKDGKHVLWENDMPIPDVINGHGEYSVRVGRSKSGRLLDGVDWGDLPWNNKPAAKRSHAPDGSGYSEESKS